MTLLSIGDRVLPGTYRLHSRFQRVVNLRDGDRLISVVDREIGAGPINVVVWGLDLTEIRSLSLDCGTLDLDGRWSSVAPVLIYDSALHVGAGLPVAFEERLALFGRLLCETSNPKSLAFLLDRRRETQFRPGFERALMRRLSHGVATIFSGNLTDGAAIVRGCGFGLTPSGDDFLAGLLIAMRILERIFCTDLHNAVEAVYESSRSGNMLTDTLLALAKDGRLTERMRDLIVALLHGTAHEIRGCTERLMQIGETSGADLGTGLYMTMRSRRSFLRHACHHAPADTFSLHEEVTK